jgi:hypothetical protein
MPFLSASSEGITIPREWPNLLTVAVTFMFAVTSDYTVGAI